jgi:phosphopantothenoylcysteine decarboxylase/phosphopantothenate--cysteine ligase
VARVDVSTVADMLDAVRAATAECDALVMAAAPADFRPETAADQKIKKTPESDGLTVRLAKTPDILGSIEGGGVRVGFAAETEKVAENAAEKLRRKRLDFIVANDVTQPGSGFAVDTNQVTLFHADGRVEALPLMAKYAVGHAIWDRVLAVRAAR